MKREELFKAIEAENLANADVIESISLYEYTKACSGNIKQLWSPEKKRVFLNTPMLKIATGRVHILGGYAYYSKDNRVQPYSSDEFWTKIIVDNEHFGGCINVEFDGLDSVCLHETKAKQGVASIVETINGHTTLTVNCQGTIDEIRIYGQLRNLDVSGMLKTNRNGVRNKLTEYTVEHVTNQAQSVIDADTYYKAPLVIQTEPYLKD